VCPGDVTRLAAPEGEICVCDLTGGDFDVSGPTVSHHLKVMCEAGLIDGERPGTWVYYGVIPSALAPLLQVLDTSALTAPDR
jgi:ArsR family transcriptional regulator, arsenate/arsenite/antimonite-responsive transcriptional repressor